MPPTAKAKEIYGSVTKSLQDARMYIGAINRQEEISRRLQADGLVRRELKIKEKPLISSNKTPPGTRRKDREEGKTAEQGQRRTKPKTGLGGERRVKCTKVERRKREREKEGWAPLHRREKGAKEPIL